MARKSGSKHIDATHYPGERSIVRHQQDNLRKMAIRRTHAGKRLVHDLIGTIAQEGEVCDYSDSNDLQFQLFNSID